MLTEHRLFLSSAFGNFNEMTDTFMVSVNAFTPKVYTNLS